MARLACSVLGLCAAVPREGEGEEVAAAEKDIEKAASGGRL